MLKLIFLIFTVQVLTCSAGNHRRNRRQPGPEPVTKTVQSDELFISGLRLESKSNGEFVNGVVEIISQDVTTVRLFGRNINNSTQIKFTSSSDNRGKSCGPFQTSEIAKVTPDLTNDSGTISVEKLEVIHSSTTAAYYICARNNVTGLEDFIHQGNSSHLQIRPVEKYWIPLWVQIVIVILLQLLSGLFSGLNLGLLSLDPTELQIVASVGASKEKKYAKHIIPLRKKGNFLLCSLVIANALANSSLTILLDDLMSGILAVVFSTIGIVLFGEIVPQALCNRFGLAIGSATRHITYIVMGLTCVVSYPLSRLLDFLLGREIGTVYDRERLVELIRVTMDHNLLESDEVNIISGTLSLKRKKVGDIMTPLDDVFMLPYDAVLDFETLSEITREGYTRIPVYESNRANIVGLLNIKDLALLDPDDCTAVRTLCKYYSYELCFVIEDTTLDVILEEFKKGRSHMAFVQQYTSDEDHDPSYQTIGLVTLEDIIEEMIQAEILDESDKNSQDKKKPLRKDFSVFSSRPLYSSLITPQLQHAAFQFLSTSVEPFRSELLSEQIVRRLIRHPEVARLIRRKPTDIEPAFLFQAGRPTDHFVLILEGRVEVKIGFEGLIFESGPFTHFGVSALAIPPEELASLSKAPFPALPSPRPSQLQPRINLERSSNTGVFVPDFTVYAMSDVLFLRIKRSHYVAAIRATTLERQGKLAPGGVPVEDMFGQEMDRCAKEDVGVGTDFSPAVNVASKPGGSQMSLHLPDPSSTADLSFRIEKSKGSNLNNVANGLELDNVKKKHSPE